MICYGVPKKLMISAGEASGELYGALLSREIKKLWPDIELFGIGGPRMKDEGVNLIAPISSVFGLTETLRHIKEIRRTFKKAREALLHEKPDILVLIDYPDFNIALAKRARSAGIPILYYVSPQVWAWRRGRIKKIASLVNKIAVLFPFEVDYYKNTGLPCEFVGHPVIETLNITQTKEELKQKLGLSPDKPVIALLPGSRPTELRRHLPVIKEVATKIHDELKGFQIIVPLTSWTELNEKLMDYIRVVRDRTKEALACSEVSAIASGTATLEAALLGTPMVVYYRLSPLTFFFAKLLTNVQFISLVNLLSGKEIVRELIQKHATPDNIFSELKKILNDSDYRNNMISHLREIRKIMEGKTPSKRVAHIVGELAGWNNINA